MANNDSLFNPASLTVVIVDDHDPIRKAIRRVVLGLGFGEVIECFDGEDALKVLNKHPVDLMVLDLFMRNVSGFDLLEHIRNRNIASDIPVIVVTGEASKEEIVKVADMGAEDYLLKPFQAVDLEKKITKTLNKYYSPTPLLKALRAGERAFLSEDYVKALTNFEEALRLDPQSARATHGLSLSLDKLNRPGEALKALNESIKTNQSYHKSFGAVADILLKQNRTAEAIVAMEHELEINPKQPNRQIYLAKLLHKENRAKEAAEHYRVALRDNPKHLEALMGMGHAVAVTENLDKALYYFKRVRRYHPTATKALEAAMRYAFAAGEPRKAELLLKDEKLAHPDRIDVVVLLALYYVKQEREDEALQTTTDILKVDPVNQHALRIQSNLLMKKLDYNGALAALQQLAAANPSPEAFNSVAEVLLLLDRSGDAVEALQRSLALDPNKGATYLIVAQAHAKSLQWAKAALLYRRAALLGADKERCHKGGHECAQALFQRRSRAHRAAS